MKSLSIVFNSLRHRVDRVLIRLILQSSELGPSHPLIPRRVCPPPFGSGGGHTRLREEGGGSQFGQGDRHCGNLGTSICLLCGLKGNKCKQSPFDVIQEV
jgi:hypothetical protein